MNMNPLPPQAYTKETLGKAFAWLQTQSENIKEMATSSDVLVSLYLKAKLNGNGALERPSIQNFKSELKSLAGMMGEFEVVDPSMSSEARLQNEMQYSRQSAVATTPPPIQPPLHSTLQAQSQFQSLAQTVAQSSVQAPAQSTVQTHSQPSLAQPIVQPLAQHSPSQTPSPQATEVRLDAQSLAMIHEVKVLLNLSSDSEALRALISVGTRALRKI